MTYIYRNRNTDDVVSYPQPNLRLERLANWDRVGSPAPVAPAEDEDDSTGDDSTEGGSTTPPAPVVPSLYDPAEDNVDEVNERLDDASPEEVARVLAAEAVGRNRTGIVNGRHAVKA